MALSPQRRMAWWWASSLVIDVARRWSSQVFLHRSHVQNLKHGDCELMREGGGEVVFVGKVDGGAGVYLYIEGVTDGALHGCPSLRVSRIRAPRSVTVGSTF